VSMLRLERGGFLIEGCVELDRQTIYTINYIGIGEVD